MLKDEQRRCFVGHSTAFQTWFGTSGTWAQLCDAAYTNTPWVELHGAKQRKTLWCVSEGCLCKYKYGGVTAQPAKYPSWLSQIEPVVMYFCGLNDPALWPNSCNLNLYEQGQIIRPHADDEHLFNGRNEDTRVISLSLGCTATFDVIANVAIGGKRVIEKAITLREGDLCTMEAMTQKHYQHQVLNSAGKADPGTMTNGRRINISWRWIKNHQPACKKSRRSS